MIQLLGSQEGQEALAARDLRGVILTSCPWVEKDKNAAISLIAGVQCHGQKPRDVDIVLLATFDAPVRFSPFLEISWGGPPFRPKEAFLDSLCVTIEVKEHDPASVRFTAGRVEVRYSRDGQETWSSATDQSEGQKYSLKNYLEHNRLVSAYIGNLIWLKNALNNQLPPRPHNILGRNSTWELFINVLFQLDRSRGPAGEWQLSARRADAGRSFQSVVNLLTRTIQLTGLDRARMDRVTKAALRDEWVDLVGTRQLILRGRGRCGKTMLLLQLAWRLYESLGKRVLILTYNRALAADIKRMLTLLGVPDDVGYSHLQVQTVYAFFFALLIRLGVVAEDEPDLLGHYEDRKAEGLELLRNGVLTAEDLSTLKREEVQAFGWNYIFIDEAQDWPDDERDILRYFYTSDCFVVADGIEQLIRGAECDWNVSLPPSTSKTVFLPTCYRMKAGLADFCNAVAAKLGLGTWRVSAHTEAPGGRVVVLEGDPFDDLSLYRGILSAGRAAGNHPVDMLGCVPPQLVDRDNVGKPVGSLAGRRMSELGVEIWDAVVADTRTGYPISPDEFRVVPYDSSRGLEGWAVFLWGLDDFFDYKVGEWHADTMSITPDADHQASLFAARWLMIPLTRAIDTLVIQVGNRSSPLKTALREVADACQDFVEWRKARQ
jgi:hypothetical protein